MVWRAVEGMDHLKLFSFLGIVIGYEGSIGSIPSILSIYFFSRKIKY
jgi:hypothetical protein